MLVHLGCFHLLAIVNSAVISMDVQTSVRFSVFIVLGGIYPEVELLGHMVILGLVFLGTAILFSIVEKIFNYKNYLKTLILLNKIK